MKLSKAYSCVELMAISIPEYPSAYDISRPHVGGDIRQFRGVLNMYSVMKDIWYVERYLHYVETVDCRIETM